MATIRKRTKTNGETVFDVRIQLAGRPTVSKTFDTKDEAQHFANTIENRHREGKKTYLDLEKILFSNVVKELMDYHGTTTIEKVSRKTGKPIVKEVSNLTSGGRLSRINVLEYDLGQYSIAELTHDRIKNYIATLLQTTIPPRANRKKIHKKYNGDIAKTYTPGSVRKFYYELKKVLQWHSLRHNYELNPNLFLQQEVPAGWDGKRERRLEADEEKTLLAKATPDFQDLIQFACETAMRSQEMVFCEVRDYNAQHRTIHLRAEIVKTKTSRIVPLSKKATEIVERRVKGKTKDERIFDCFTNTEQVSSKFYRLCYDLKIKNLKIHDLRHEAISRFFEKNRLSDMEIMKISGHTSFETLAGYTHLRPSKLVDKMD
ncbi:MAG: site-specific integrase [Gallionella sp.]|nr:site-specific integrase [Gallionella sp.]